MGTRKMLLDRVIPSAHGLMWTRANTGGLQYSLTGGNMRQVRGGNRVVVLPPLILQQQQQQHLHQQQQQQWNRIKDGFKIDTHDYYTKSPNVVEAAPSDDLLGANKFGNKFLMNNKQQCVPVESLRGKILALYFERSLDLPPYCLDEVELDSYVVEFYNALKLTKPGCSFEMIYVPPLPNWEQQEEENPSVHNAILSTLPWLYVPVRALDWRCYLHQVYNHRNYATDIAFIDTRDNKVELLPRDRCLKNIYRYGPEFYPFTTERVQQLEAESKLFGKETSIQAILGSDSRDYLIDRHSNKVPISFLQDKDVLIYPFTGYDGIDDMYFELLLQTYTELQNPSFEIVSVNLDYNGGHKVKEELWKDHLAQIPWLSLPFGDKKTWALRNLIYYTVDHDNDGDPILFVKPKGESLLDPYGFPVFDKIGGFPFTRSAGAQFLVTNVKELSFSYFVDVAFQLGLDFSTLIRNKDNGETENVSLSTILEGESKGILLLFASLETCSRERLQSLISVYRSQDKSSSSFEVIFVSIDKDTQSFDENFSIMPWLAFPGPLRPSEHMKWARLTTEIDFNGYSHFIAFGPDRFPLQIGLLTKSFENCEFPFLSDAESVEHVAFCITKSLGLEREADGTPCYDGDGWWRGIEYEYAATACLDVGFPYADHDFYNY